MAVEVFKTQVNGVCNAKNIVTYPPKPGQIHKLGIGREKGYTLGKAGETCQRKPLQPNKSSAS
jgi:hypothetical protein